MFPPFAFDPVDRSRYGEYPYSPSSHRDAATPVIVSFEARVGTVFCMTHESAGEPTRIVVVGSGFAGFECARALARRLRGTDARITMIAPHDYMLYTPLLPEVAGGILDARFVTVPLSEALPHVELVKGSVDSVDFGARTVHVTDCEQGVEDVAWDRLVLTPGSVTRLFDIPGLAEHARGLETPAEALYFRDQLLTQIELAERDTDPSVAVARRTVVVVGASYAGTELTAQLRALADEAAARRNLDPAKIRFLLLDAADTVMPEVGEKLGGKVLDVLRSRGIDVRLETTLAELGPEHVTLDDGTVIPTRTVAWVTGVTAGPLIDTLGLPTEKGRLTVRPDLSVDGHPSHRPARRPARTGPGPQRRGKPGRRRPETVQPSRHGPGRRSRPGVRRREPPRHPAVGVPREGGHARLPPLRDAERGQSLGGRSRLPHRSALPPPTRVDRAGHRFGITVRGRRGRRSTVVKPRRFSARRNERKDDD